MKRWMGLDVGTMRIGVALSDPLKLTARPLCVIPRGRLDSDVEAVLRLAAEHEVERIVVGRPMRLSGEPGSTALEVETFVLNLRELSDLPVVLAEERLSSKEAERLMATLNIPVRERRKRRDEVAAALILIWYLEDERHGRGY